MSKKSPIEIPTDLTPLEKIEYVFNDLVQWYGDAEKKEVRVAAKLLLVSLEKFSQHAGPDWADLVGEYIDILKKDPEKFQKILEANRGELKGRPDKDRYH
ncbi:hypothetical protein Q7C_2239 [Methylophaga frappieri]|uniref:Uncharacterized protein n=1 Tax=Methylophaga frappieri (strain ATCC BAA-2434 / DSM 25690 / JAM7) TaxID=754477 RepID=I1YKD2_METFJ|nr:hypothetical protein [Methylophaga frappieri]AFJ03375.1 hypothetical protein Q7C_2239 [Methylophaga frappieri]